MNKTLPKNRLWLEWVTFFVVVPLLLLIPQWLIFNLILIGLCLIYIVYQSHQQGYFKEIFIWKKRAHSISIWLRFLTFAVVSAVAIYWYRPELLFSPIINNWSLWLFILGVYTLMSVLPQEFLYRVFYQKRYGQLFSNRILEITTNALIFSLAHLFLLNGLVLILTFIGGWLFYFNYQKNKSYLLVCTEHAAYGIWIYTLGAGQMLAFPG